MTTPTRIIGPVNLTVPRLTRAVGLTLARMEGPVGLTLARIVGETGAAQSTTPTPPVNVVAPLVTGTPTEGELLTSTSGTWTGTLPISYAYQWYRTSGLGSTPIGGATASTYTLTAAEVGEDVWCVVTATNAAGSADESSNNVGPIASAAVAPGNTVAPVVTGFVAVGQTLGSTTGTWTGTPTPTYSYQWEADTGSGFAAIGGETAATYVVDAARVAADLRCVVTATNTAGAVAANSVAVASPLKTILADARLVEIRTARGNADVFRGLDAAANGDPIGSWTGHKGTSATQATTGAKPTRQANGADFDGTDDWLELTSAEATELATVGWTMLVLLRDNPSPSGSRIIWSCTDNGSGGLDVVNLNSTGDFVKAVSGSGTVVANAANPTTPTCVWVAVEGTGTNLVRYRQSGTETTHTMGTYPSGLTRAALGCRVLPTPVLFHDGTIAAQAVFSGALSFADMRAYEAILTTAGVL